MGSDLIPPVDNVTTFDTTLSVETINLLFSDSEDTTSSGVLQFLGNINNDPLFGRTEGRMYFQVAPSTARRPFPFIDKSNLVGLDSVVLVLGYNNTYGDTMQAQQVAVYEIPNTVDLDTPKITRSIKNISLRLGLLCRRLRPLFQTY